MMKRRLRKVGRFRAISITTRIETNPFSVLGFVIHALDSTIKFFIIDLIINFFLALKRHSKLNSIKNQ